MLCFSTDGSPATIERMNPDGTGREVVVGDIYGIEGTVEYAGTVYWGEYGTGPENRVGAVDIDGTNERTIAAGQYIWGVAIDEVNQHVYWADAGNSQIVRAGLDGANPEVVLSVGARWLALDPLAEMIYWNSDPPGSLSRTSYDGSVQELIATTSTSWAYELEVDLSAGKLYWTDADLPGIRRANLDGTGAEDLIIMSPSSVLPTGIALDLVNGRIYYTDFQHGRIYRANLADGSNPEVLLSVAAANSIDVCQ